MSAESMEKRTPVDAQTLYEESIEQGRIAGQIHILLNFLVFLMETKRISREEASVCVSEYFNRITDVHASTGTPLKESVQDVNQAIQHIVLEWLDDYKKEAL